VGLVVGGGGFGGGFSGGGGGVGVGVGGVLCVVCFVGCCLVVGDCVWGVCGVWVGCGGGWGGGVVVGGGRVCC